MCENIDQYGQKMTFDMIIYLIINLHFTKLIYIIELLNYNCLTLKYN